MMHRYGTASQQHGLQSAVTPNIPTMVRALPSKMRTYMKRKVSWRLGDLGDSGTAGDRRMPNWDNWSYGGDWSLIDIFSAIIYSCNNPAMSTYDSFNKILKILEQDQGLPGAIGMGRQWSLSDWLAATTNLRMRAFWSKSLGMILAIPQTSCLQMLGISSAELMCE